MKEPSYLTYPVTIPNLTKQMISYLHGKNADMYISQEGKVKKYTDAIKLWRCNGWDFRGEKVCI